MNESVMMSTAEFYQYPGGLYVYKRFSLDRPQQ